MLKKGKKIYEGKTKKVYLTEEQEYLIQEFKDEAVAAHSKKNAVKGSGTINNELSAHLFRYLESYHIPTHYVKRLGDTSMLIRRLDIIPVEVLVRNVAVGDAVKNYETEEGAELPQTVLEYYLKDEERKDPRIDEDHLISYGHATQENIEKVRRTALKVNAVLRDFFMRRNLKLIDVRIEFGRLKDKLLLGDEVSLETCRFLDMTDESMKLKDRLRFNFDTPEVYEEMRQRIIS